MSDLAQVNEHATPLRPAAARGGNAELRFVEHVVGDVVLQRGPTAFLANVLTVLILTILDHPGGEHAASMRVRMAGAFSLRSVTKRLFGWGIRRLADGGPCPPLPPRPTLASLRYGQGVAGSDVF